MMMDRCHQKHPLARPFINRDLDNHRNRLHHEQAADNRKHDFVVDRYRNHPQRAAQRQAAGIAHEHGGGRRIKPQKRQTRAHHSGAINRQLARAGHMRDAKIGRIICAPGQIGNDRKGARRDDYRHGSEAIEPIGEVYRIARAHDHKGGEQIIRRPHRNIEIAEHRHIKIGIGNDDGRCNARNRKFCEQSHPGRHAFVRIFGHLVIIVEKSDQAEAQGDSEARPDKPALHIHP